MDFTFDLDEFSSVEDILEMPEELLEKTLGPPARAYVRDRRSKRCTPADVKEFPGATVYVVDMPGVKSADINVHVEHGKVLVVEGGGREGGEVREEGAAHGAVRAEVPAAAECEFGGDHGGVPGRGGDGDGDG